MVCWVLPRPWSLLLPLQAEGAAYRLEDAGAYPPVPAAAVTFLLTSECGRLRHTSVAGERYSAALLCQGGRAPNGRQMGNLVLLPQPADGGDVWQVSDVASSAGISGLPLRVEGAVRRVTAHQYDEAIARLTVDGQGEERTGDGSHDLNPPEVLREAVDLMVGFFDEVLNLADESENPEEKAFANQPFVRIGWQKVWHDLISVDQKNQPRMALIYRVARHNQEVISAVCQSPRRMLRRSREEEAVDRVRELDSACLRDLIRRPGRTVLEKAGSRQRILAVVRRDTHDTHENRVIKDLLRLCKSRALVYERLYMKARGSERVRTVSRFRIHCQYLARHTPISEAGALTGMATANYVLQKDPRYSPLWKIYQKLLREQTAVDEIWPWSRRLWAECVRTMVAAFLLGEDGAAETGFRPQHEIPVYLRREQATGTFCVPLSFSAALADEERALVLHMVHPHHAHLYPALQPLLSNLGADGILVILNARGRNPSPRLLVPIYAFLQTGLAQDVLLHGLAPSMAAASASLGGVPVRPLLYLGDAVAENAPFSCRPVGDSDSTAGTVMSGWCGDREGWLLQTIESIPSLLKSVG